MCGIIGFSGYGDSHKSSLQKSIKKIYHRGPDDQGIELFDTVGLGHTRLSIIDLSPAGHQPMFNHDKTLCVVFNGEIYNFKEVRSKLINKYNFKSQSDTEVLLYAYEEWGTACLKELTGMFAFVIYDVEKNMLFGARDRLGEKPLKYYFKDGLFVFASEVKVIVDFLGNDAQIDPIAIDNFLTFQYVPVPLTGFKDIKKLPAGHFFVLQNGKLDIQQYWNINFENKLDLSYADWKKLILDGVEKAVVDRMVSDVPIGAFLSGGVDSSAVVAYMAKNSTSRIKTFSMGFDDPDYDETSYALEVSQKYHTDHSVLRLTAGDLVSNLDTVLSFYDEPFADNSSLPTFLLSKFTRNAVTVALVGDGGDENFAGYDRYNIIRWSHLYGRTPHVFRKNILHNLIKLNSRIFNTKLSTRSRIFADSFEEPFSKRIINYNSSFSTKAKASLYNSQFKAFVHDNDSFEYFEADFNKNVDLIDNALYFDIKSYLPENLLFKTDIASMAFALELRAPLLDYKFMELVSKMPSSMKISYFEKKLLFKRILVEEGILPKSVVYRKKRGFNIPVRKWLKHDLKDYVNDNILSEAMFNIFDKKALTDYVHAYYSSNAHYDNNMYTLLALSKWLSTYFSK